MPHGDSPDATTVTLSMGLAMARLGQPQQDAETLLLEADLALYQAKRGGRNRIVLAGTSPSGPAPQETA
jgi:PleD family two-component response regulator